jgi:polar amino acid transport system substrate-binding protein
VRERSRVARLGLLAAAVVLAGGCAATSPPVPSPPPEPTPTPVPPIRIGVTGDSPPFCFRQAGRLAGIEIDLASYLGQDLGRPVRAIAIPWEEMIPALVNREIDIIMSGMTVTRLRQLRVAFSEPYVRSGLGVLVRRNEADRGIAPARAVARADKIGVTKGTTAEKYVREHSKDSQIFAFTSNVNALAELEQGRVDAFVADAPIVAWYAALDEGALEPLLHPLLTKDEIAWGFRPGDAELREQADRSLAHWKRDGTLGGVLRRWLPGWEPVEEEGTSGAGRSERGGRAR